MSTRIATKRPVRRKEPQQARSRATVASILEAGARILSESGWAGFTTNAVADLAGVSIGSLYQYFPDKLVLIDAIRRRHLDDCFAAMKSMVTVGRTPLQFAEELVDAMMAAHSVHPGLHRVLLDEAPQFDTCPDQDSQFETEYLSCYVNAVQSFRNRVPSHDRYVAALIVSDAIDGVIHNAARRGMLADATVRSELVRIISLYLADNGAGPT